MTHLVVTGTGRSGTGWCAATLNSAGIFTGHERVFTPKAAEGGLIDWCEYHADCSWLAVPRLPLMNVRAALVIRNPLQVVASMAHIRFGVEGYENDHSRVAAGYGMTPDIDGYLRFWVTWNTAAIIAGHVEAIFTLDQLLQNPMTLTRWAGAKHEPRPVGVVNDRADWKIDARPVIGWDDFQDVNMLTKASELWESLSVSA